MNYSSSFEVLLDDFVTQGIDVNQPGFYDHPNFLKVEQNNPQYLNNYANFIGQKSYSEEYLNRAERVIRIVSTVLLSELQSDGRIGACIDVSMVMSRILDIEGIWNYISIGALTINFPQESMIPDLYFWPIDNTQAKAGHVWVSAPPFEIIDISPSLQDYKYDVDEYLPDYVIEGNVEIAEVNPKDIFSPIARRFYQAQGISYSRLINRVLPHLPEFINTFPPYSVSLDGVTFKYICTGISASDAPLGDITSLRLNNRFGINIYEELIRPELE